MDLYYPCDPVILWRKKIPDLMRGIGKGIKEFNDGKHSVKNEINEGMKEKDVTATPAQKPAVPIS